jgi:5'-3' exonuclease
MDLCILLGCDYCDSIKGIGQKRALDLIKQYRNIETILKHIDTKVNFYLISFLICIYFSYLNRNIVYLMNGHMSKQDNYSKNLMFYQAMQLMLV